tara:strand:+ start:598 stop:744 length:147 start_codon:yes stop_codon:yes gene_type:complete
LGGVKIDIPELLKLLATENKIFKNEVSCMKKKSSKLKKKAVSKIKISS